MEVERIDVRSVTEAASRQLLPPLLCHIISLYLSPTFIPFMSHLHLHSIEYLVQFEGGAEDQWVEEKDVAPDVLEDYR